MDSSSRLFLGIDLGTSGCRGMVIDEQETCRAQARHHFDSSINSKGHHQQDAHVWWHAVIDVIQQLGKQINLGHIVALAIDGTSGSVLLTDADGNPLHAALMYNDARATQETEQLEQLNIDNSAVLSPTSGLAKLLWLKQQGFSQQAHYFLHQADWINGKLLNKFGDTDINNALKTGYDPIRQKWPDWFSQLDINLNWLPRVHQPGDGLGTIDNPIARQLGLNTATKIIAGTTDSTAAIIATGASQVGEAVTSLGSTLVVKVIADKPVSNSKYGIYSQPFGKYWLAGGASNTGGAVLKQFFTDEQLITLSEEINIDNPTGLDYYPLPSTGERFPVNDPEKPSLITPRPEEDAVFLQALLESMARIEQQGYQQLNELGAPYPVHVLTCGGGAKNQVWNKIRENYLKVPVSEAHHQEAAFGMALIAKHSKCKRENNDC